MARPTRRALAFAAAGTLLLAGAARADCVEGVRAVKPAEQEFHERAVAAVAAALPNSAAPLERRGIVDFAKIPPLTDLCSDTKTGAFSVDATAGYLRTFSPAEIDARNAKRRALEKQIEQLRALPPGKQAEQDALNQQARAVYDSVPRRSRKDPPFTPEQQALVDQRTAEGRALEDKARRVSFDYSASVESQVAPLREQASALDASPQQFGLTIKVNAPEWDLRPSGNVRIASFGPMLKQPGAGLSVKQVAIVLSGPDGPAKDALFAAIDQEYLRGLLDKPLPPTAQSGERAARVATATVAPEVAGSPALAGAAAAGAGTAATTTAATASAASGTKPKCPPPAGNGGVDAGAEVGGAVIGGGYGRNVGRTIGGALGALGGSKKKAAPPPDCVP
jgi:hypothetical protein